MTTTFATRPETADLARQIVDALKGINDEISDTTLASVVGQPVTPASAATRSALRELQRAVPPVHFRRLRNYGWKRMHDTDLVAHSEVDLKKISRGARRGRKRLNSVHFSALNSRDQLQAARNNARFAAIEDASANTTVKRQSNSSIPDLNDVLKSIKSAS